MCVVCVRGNNDTTITCVRRRNVVEDPHRHVEQKVNHGHVGDDVARACAVTAVCVGCRKWRASNQITPSSAPVVWCVYRNIAGRQPGANPKVVDAR